MHEIYKLIYNHQITKNKFLGGLLIMKKWNTPELEVLNVNETANGIFNCDTEFCIWTNDSKKAVTPTPEEQNS